MDMLVDRRCFFPFSFVSLWFPARRCDISGTLVVPLVFFVVLASILGVPIRDGNRSGRPAGRDAGRVKILRPAGQAG